MEPINYQRLEKQLREKYRQILPYLNERQKRLITAADAISIGYKGISIVSRVSGLSRPTIYQGIKELNENSENSIRGESFFQKTFSSNRIRKLGGGRKKVSEKTPELVAEIEKIVAPSSRGAPQSPLQWTCIRG